MTRIERLIRQVNIYGRDKEQKFLWAEKTINFSLGWVTLLEILGFATVACN
jgi:hypothetical protein